MLLNAVLVGSAFIACTVKEVLSEGTKTLDQALHSLNVANENRLAAAHAEWTKNAAVATRGESCEASFYGGSVNDVGMCQGSVSQGCYR